MKYVILIQSNAAVAELFAGMSDEERGTAYQSYWDIENDLLASGELVTSEALEERGQRAVTRAVDGFTDAPLPETTEVVSGFYLVDVTGAERAHEIAARFPEAAVGGIVVARTLTQEDFDAMGA